MKRETIYIRDKDQWNKENDSKTNITNVIEKVASKNLKLIPEWHKEHPESKVVNTKQYDQHVSIMIEAIGGLGGSLEANKKKNNDKVIRNILSSIYLDRQNVIMNNPKTI